MPGPTLAEAMRDFLVELGVPSSDIILESRSRSTYENALQSARLLKDRGIRKIILVTEAAHMPRALGTFRKQGLEAVPAPCHYISTAWFERPLLGLLPAPGTLRESQGVLHEWLGMAWYRLRGRM
jgi:uncharacterized SAM-binding protein YcdF (DUF218 family)